MHKRDVAIFINKKDYIHDQDNGTNLQSKYGHPFVLNDDEWILSRDVTINLGWLKYSAGETLEASYRICLSSFARFGASLYCMNINNRFKMLVEEEISKTEGRIIEVTARNIMIYRETLREDQSYFLIALKQLFRRWEELKLPGINRDVYAYFDEARIRPNKKGVAVATQCPHEGPLTDVERSMAYDVLVDAYEDGNIDGETFAICMTLMLTGRRPSQIADLKIRDLKRVESSDGASTYFLNIPRRKQRGSWRAESTPVKLVGDLGLAIELQIKAVRHRITVELGHVPPESVSDFPIFPNWKIVKKQWRSGDGRLLVCSGNELIHMKSNSLSSILSDTIDDLRVPSRTPGMFLHITPTRVRRTFGTEAAREGHAPEIIAEILDHSDTQNVTVYTENVPERLRRIDKATVLGLAEFAQVFRGEIISGPEDPVSGCDPAGRVRAVGGAGCGNCGRTGGDCFARAPYACYTCRSFQPWLNGPHEEFLDHLIEERGRLAISTRDARTASVLDGTIIAVAEVVRLCKSGRAAVGNKEAFE